LENFILLIINTCGLSNIEYKTSTIRSEKFDYLEEDTFNLDFFMYNYLSTSKKLSLFETSSSTFLNFLIIYLIKNIFLDGVSLWLLWLVLTVGYVLSFSKSKKKIINNNIFKKNFVYNNLLNFIIFLMAVCFLSKDLFIFFIAFESILFPLFLYIILQGSRLNKIYAVKYLVIYTIVGSVFLWYSIAYIVEILGVSNFDHIK
jgi:NADH:ubiquinone oxidoreductase subunit 4 (subunit M)